MKAFTSRRVAATTGAICSQVERSWLSVVTGDSYCSRSRSVSRASADAAP